MRRKLLFIPLLALLILPGCAFLRGLFGAAVKKPTLTFESWSAQDLSLDGVTISLKYRIDNPNDVGFSLASLSYALDVERRRVAAGDLPGGVSLKAKGASPLIIPVRLKFADIPSFLQSVFTKDALGYKVAGDIGLSSPIGTVELPYSHTDRVPVPRLPSVSIDSVRVASASLSSMNLQVRLKVANGNGFPLPAAQLSYGVALDGASIATGQSAVVAAIPARGASEWVLPISVDLLKAGPAVARAVRSGTVEASVRGSAGYGSLALPLDLRRRVAVSR
jgi:LEA14-like dessication related protein